MSAADVSDCEQAARAARARFEASKAASRNAFSRLDCHLSGFQERGDVLRRLGSEAVALQQELFEERKRAEVWSQNSSPSTTPRARFDKKALRKQTTFKFDPDITNDEVRSSSELRVSELAARIESERLAEEKSELADQVALQESRCRAATVALEIMRVDGERRAAEQVEQFTAECRARESRCRAATAAIEVVRVDGERKAAEQVAQLTVECREAQQMALLESKRRAAEELGRCQAERRLAEDATRRELQMTSEMASLKSELKDAEGKMAWYKSEEQFMQRKVVEEARAHDLQAELRAVAYATERQNFEEGIAQRHTEERVRHRFQAARRTVKEELKAATELSKTEEMLRQRFAADVIAQEARAADEIGALRAEMKAAAATAEQASFEELQERRAKEDTARQLERKAEIQIANVRNQCREMEDAVRADAKREVAQERLEIEAMRSATAEKASVHRRSSKDGERSPQRKSRTSPRPNGQEQHRVPMGSDKRESGFTSGSGEVSGFGLVKVADLPSPASPIAEKPSVVADNSSSSLASTPEVHVSPDAGNGLQTESEELAKQTFPYPSLETGLRDLPEDAALSFRTTQSESSSSGAVRPPVDRQPALLPIGVTHSEPGGAALSSRKSISRSRSPLAARQSSSVRRAPSRSGSVSLTPGSARSRRSSAGRQAVSRPPSSEDYGHCLSDGVLEALALPQLDSCRQAAASNKLPLEAFKDVRQFDSVVEVGKDVVNYEFEAVAPEVFRDLRRNAFGVQDDDFANSMALHPLTGGMQGEGKSGMLFFFSWDKRYIAKTTDSVEVPFFFDEVSLAAYHKHLRGKDANYLKDLRRSASFLPRFSGFYGLKIGNEPKSYLVVFENIFPPGVTLKEKYDLKGVLGSKRYVSDEQRAQGIEVLKDRNFLSRSLNVGEEMKQRLTAQLRKDTQFLEERGRIDYSLLLGVANLDVVKERPHEAAGSQWPTMESRGARSVGRKGAPGDEVFFLGIIDILQEYTSKKAMESKVKSVKFGLTHMLKSSTIADSSNAVSAVAPAPYAKRFLDFIVSKME